MKYIYIYFCIIMNLLFGFTYRSIRKNHVNLLHKKFSNYLYIQKQNTWVKTPHNQFFIENPQIANKKLITISNGGYNGLYMLGICSYIKQHFPLDDCIFSGISAGAWNSLLLCCRQDTTILVKEIIHIIKDMKNLKEIEQYLKQRLLSTFTSADFDFQKLFIGTTTLEKCKPVSNIYHGFTDLEEAIDCCIASSHIPFVTGGMVNRYNNMTTFDGAFSTYSYLNKKSVLHITPHLWKNKKPKHKYIPSIQDYTSLFSRNKYNFVEMYQNGYNDTKKNHYIVVTQVGVGKP